jgi:hypothetical protein
MAISTFMVQAFLEQLIRIHVIKKLPSFYGTLNLIANFPNVSRRLTLSSSRLHNKRVFLETLF